MKRKLIASIAVVAAVVVGSVAALQLTSRSGYADDGRLAVAASYYPLYDFAKQIGGDKVTVMNMTPAGAEPHDYEPSPQELIRAHESAVFIYNGGPMEPWVGSFLADYKHIEVSASQGISLKEGDHGHNHDHEHGHEHEDEHKGGDVTQDPHFWLDPVLAQQIVYTIRDGLSEADPDNSAYYAENAERYNQKLAELDRSFAEGLSGCTLDTVISSHGAFSYVADRYGFTAISIAGIEPDDEPSVARMAELTDVVRQKNIKYVFFESLVSPRLAETIALEAGVETLVFDPIEGLAQAEQDKGRDYISIQYDNLRNLRTALGCN